MTETSIKYYSYALLVGLLWWSLFMGTTMLLAQSNKQQFQRLGVDGFIETHKIKITVLSVLMTLLLGAITICIYNF